MSDTPTPERLLNFLEIPTELTQRIRALHNRMDLGDGVNQVIQNLLRCRDVGNSYSHARVAASELRAEQDAIQAALIAAQEQVNELTQTTIRLA